ncbi:DUF4105 domain-containing protein [Myxococcota bacterium]|nr:DUF4105 domain-containing protein [Myxococcota bacterium]
MKLFGRLLLAIAILLGAIWSALAAYFGPFASLALAFSIGAAGIAASVAVAIRRWARPTAVVFALAFVAFVSAWSRIEPSNDRDWQPDVARLPRAEIDGDRVTLRDIRDFDYRTETDYTPRYYDKTFDLRELDEVDLITVYWMGDAIAHVMLGFGFAGRDYLTISIETRKEKGESYDTIRGFFRQYELIYVVGDDRDLIRLRTTFRKDPVEDVYLYRTAVTRENARRLFLDYLREINSLHEAPEFYNTGTTNCTTNVYRHTKVNPGRHDFSWKILLSGYAAEYVYDHGMLDTRMPFEALRRASHVNEAARAAEGAADFSQRIREGLPRPAAPAVPR